MMKMKSTKFAIRSLALVPLLSLTVFSATALAQDSRGTVAEPTFPAVCTQVQADLQTVNGEPSSELNTAHDTSLIQTALSACASGQAVELVANGTSNAFVIKPIFIPAGITLLVDGGVTVFASIQGSDYQIGTASSGNTCGSADSGAACYPLITVGQSSVMGTSNTYATGPVPPVSGLMGYGVINGRGGDKLITSIAGSTVTYGNSSAWDYATTGNEDVPVLVYGYKTAYITLYKITLLNSPHFHVRITGQGNVTGGKYPTNLTVWGIKLLTPWTARNTDGIDPTGTYNVSVLNSVIGDGDDEVAFSGSSQVEYATLSNLLLTSGHGLSIGSITTKGVSNIAASNLNFSGQAADSNQIGLRIKSYCGSGGAVSGVTYNGVCIQNVRLPVELDPYYSTESGTTSCPAFGTASAPITYQNLYVDTTTIGNPPSPINLQGLKYSTVTNLSNVALNNVFYNSATLSTGTVQSTDTSQQSATPAYANIALGGNYYPGGWATLSNTTNSVTETINNATAATNYPTTYCANAYPALVGELFASTIAGSTTVNNINKAVSVTVPVTLQLSAMLQPTNPVTGYAAATAAPVPTAGVQFLDGTTVVGTGSFDTSGKLAKVSIVNPTAGVHNYTAKYVGDSNYVATPFGTATYTGTQGGSMPAPTALVVTVSAGPASQLGFSPAPAAAITYGAGPGTVSVVAQDAAGDTLTSLTGTVTLTVTGSNSYAKTYTATASSGTATFSGLANPPAGSFTYAASASGLTSASAAETVSPAPLTASAVAASNLFDQPVPVFTFSVSGTYQNGDTSAVVMGAPALTTTDVPDSPAGSYPINITQGTLSAANYTFTLVAGTLTVNGGVPQQIAFQPLPNFVSGNSYQLTASASSGLGVAYSVSGPARVTGATLAVTGPGAVTVTANQAGNGSYAAATSVQQSFTAQ